MRKSTTIPLAFLAVIALSSCGAGQWVPPKSWTLRADGMLRRELSQEECAKLGKPAGCKEEFTVAEFIAKVKTEENKELAYVVTPAGEASISNKIRECARQENQAR